MAILNTVKKGFLRSKTDSGYITLKPKTDASLVSMNDGAPVENKITSLLSSVEGLNRNLSDSVSTLSQGKANAEHTHDERYYTESEVNTKINAVTNQIRGKIVHKAENIRFYSAGDKSYGYINIPENCVLLSVYLQQVSGNVSLISTGFNQSSTTGYTAWVNFSINDSVFIHWVYAVL